MNSLRVLGAVAVVLFLIGLWLMPVTHPLYATLDPIARQLVAMAATAVCWLAAVAVSGYATWRSTRQDAPRDALSRALARGPLFLLWFAFAIRLFLFAMQ